MVAAVGVARGRGMLQTKEMHGNELSVQPDLYDDYGRTMTEKRALHQLSSFHGRPPFTNKRKRMLEVEEQLTAKSEENAMNCPHAVQAVQKSTEQARVVLSTGVYDRRPSYSGGLSAWFQRSVHSRGLLACKRGGAWRTSAVESQTHK